MWNPFVRAGRFFMFAAVALLLSSILSIMQMAEALRLNIYAVVIVGMLLIYGSCTRQTG